MLGWIMDRMVERAMPPDVEDRTQERIAQEAAENAIRQVVTVAAIAGVFVFAVLAALLYGYLPSWQLVHGASQPSRVANRVGPDAAKLLQANEGKEEAEGKFQQVEMERDALQGKVADLERQLEEMAKPRTQAASAAAASQDPAERNRLQGKIDDLERQVAHLTRKLRATRAAAVPDRSGPIPKPTRPSTTPVSAELRPAYHCGDGRTVRNPANCKTTTPAPPEVVPSVPDTYHCGDGRSVPNPAACRAAGTALPRG